MMSISDLAAGVGSIYKGRVNGLRVKIEGSLKKLVTSDDNEGYQELPDDPEDLMEYGSNFGGVAGLAHESSIRNSFVVGESLVDYNLNGAHGVGGFVGESQDTEFFYNFSYANIKGQSKDKSGSCSNEALSSKAECDFECVKKDNPEFKLKNIHSMAECEGISSSTLGWEEIFDNVSTAASVCKPFHDDELSIGGITGLMSCVSSFVCIKGDGKADETLTTEKDCLNKGLCGEVSGFYNGGTVFSDYIEKDQCCIDGGDHFISNKWVRNRWSLAPKSDFSNYADKTYFWKKRKSDTSSDWTVELSMVVKGEVPNIGRFVGDANLLYDENSNALRSDSQFVGNYFAGQCKNTSTEPIIGPSGDEVSRVLREFKDDDSGFYKCLDNSENAIDDLKNQFACQRLGTCGVGGQKTLGDCRVNHSDQTWVMNTWTKKGFDDEVKSAQFTSVACSTVNLDSIKEQVNVVIDVEDREKLDTCNDSILLQMGRQDQIMFSTSVDDESYFYYRENPPLKNWNFDFFWVEKEGSFPELMGL